MAVGSPVAPNFPRFKNHTNLKSRAVKKRKRIDRKKITVRVSKDVLARAQHFSQANITETVHKALEALVAKWAYEQLLKKEGKLKVSPDLRGLREDR
jgi:succinylarginine dihydrolase